MSDNFGKRIKKLAAAFFLAETVILIFCEMMMLERMRSDKFLIALLFSVIASFFIWITSFLLYAFGELIDKISHIEKSLSDISASMPDTTK